MLNYFSFGTELYTINKLWLIAMLATALAVVLLTFTCINYFNKNNTNKSRTIDGSNKTSKSSLDEAFTQLVNSHPCADSQRLKIVQQSNSCLPGALNSTEGDKYAGDMDYSGFDDDGIHGMHVEGLVSKLKVQKLNQIKSQFTKCQLEEEKRIESKQLAAIFELLKQQELALNVKEIDEDELSAQLRLYR